MQMSGKKWWLSVQILEDRKPIDHPWNKEEGDHIKMSEGKVKYAMGITINLDNFQSARVDVGVELPTNGIREEVEEKYEEAKDFCNDKIMQEMAMLEDLKKAMKKKK
jgi:hypothetical protein